ncbi:multidrug transporter [Pseudoalteromonas luteoviolacea]|uniref:Multidrug transporter n=1 Tax=Pseudoalteromonas luteoviolacea TaxID=43657 RepID=A0A1C0TLC3_9GAMM|nr:DMT family transporter [Pseudoalteromonas luteoviolacea]MBQ4812765.1 DMT family transporter [Pseudoalteromonas luteoviolacea]OCQ19157.1 multidrug transporter [Pseudoalteromonas luteoviolacea]
MGWIFFTCLAAFSQAWRNALQSKLSKHASVAAVTLARFIFALPLAGLYLFLLYLIQPAPQLEINNHFIGYVVAASVMQIVATALMVVLFKQKSFAIGAGLAKSEAIVAAILGMIFFGSTLTFLGWVGVLIGAAAVLILSGFSLQNFNIRTAVLGLACGTCFALTSLWVREASLASALPFPHSAGWVLLWVLSCQTLLLSLYITFKEAHSWQVLKQKLSLTVLVSVTSCIGSIGWFSAMSLQHVAYVKTLGQIEVFFTILIAALWLKAPPKKRDTLGLILIAIAATLVMMS